jgi:hypothetical protein
MILHTIYIIIVLSIEFIVFPLKLTIYGPYLQFFNSENLINPQVSQLDYTSLIETLYEGM